jgi:hypothetical protein
LVTSLLMIWI